MPQPRRKRFAPKTRTGCVNCKARRVKCGEEKPICHRCTVSRLRCSYQVPKIWLFDPKPDASVDEERRPSLRASTTSRENDSDQTGGNSPAQNQLSAPLVDSPTLHAWDGPKLFESQHEHDSFQTWVTFLVRYCEPRSRFPGRITPSQDVYGLVIPQIAYHSVALREAMIACGIMVQSVQRKDPERQYDQAMATMLQHATKAIRELTTRIRPLIEVVLTAYTFWSLDLMSCKFESAMMHLLSAVRIARQCRKALASDELASTFVQCMVSNLPDAEAAPPPELDKDPPDIRRIKAVMKLEVEYDRITTCAQRLAMTNVLNKHEILAILEESRQELQWILSRYNTPELYARWLLHKKQQAGDANQKPSQLENSPGIFRQLVMNVDEYILGKASPGGVQTPIPIDLWRKDAGEESLMFMVMVAGSDLPLRQITMDFFEASRHIRWPGRSQI